MVRLSSPCTDSKAPSPSPLPPSFALRATDGPPPPLLRGRMQTSNLVLAMRSAPESSLRGKIFFALRTDLRQRMPAVAPASSRSVLQASQEPKNERKKARKRNAERRVANLRTRAGCGARGSPRARLSASHHGSLPLGVFHPKAQPGPGFVTHRPNKAVPPPARMAHPAMHLARRS